MLIREEIVERGGWRYNIRVPPATRITEQNLLSITSDATMIVINKTSSLPYEVSFRQV